MILNSLLTKMVELGASDLFITPGLSPRVKVNGLLQPLNSSPLTEGQTARLVTGTMSDRQQEEFERTNEANFGIHAEGIGRFRVSALKHLEHPAMVIRRIETQIPTVEGLELPPLLKTLAMERSGLIVLVGATGSGKSTTLASMIGHRNATAPDHIICIEDPVEFMHVHKQSIVTQREVGIDTESYDVALKNALRQAPDVLLIGEVRHRETMEQVLVFAETGHLCMTTLHATTAALALERMINFFPRDQRDQLLLDLSSSLRAIVAQKLVPRIDREGRVVATEILVNTPRVADVIRKGEVSGINDIMKRSQEHGMKSFDQAMFEHYDAGRISYENALRFATSANEVRLMIKLKGNGGEDLALQTDEPGAGDRSGQKWSTSTQAGEKPAAHYRNKVNTPV